MESTRKTHFMGCHHHRPHGKLKRALKCNVGSVPVPFKLHMKCKKNQRIRPYMGNVMAAVEAAAAAGMPATAAAGALVDPEPKSKEDEKLEHCQTLSTFGTTTPSASENCDPGMGVDAFFHALYTRNNTRIIMVLGSACSEVTEALANVMPYWNLVQVSFGSTSPALSDRSEFPFFYRTVAPDSSHNPARLAFIKKFGWDTVVALSQDEDVYTMAVNDLVTELEQANITCTATYTFAETDFRDQLSMLKERDTRIIIGSFSYEVSPKIFCQAYQLGMYGSDYVWILAGSTSDIWWDNVTECSVNHLQEAVEGLILVSSHNSLVDTTTPSCSGLRNYDFIQQMAQHSVPVTQYAPQTYDAVWSIALALKNAQEQWDCSKTLRGLNLTNFDYNRNDMAEEFLRQFGVLEFLGISGPVVFSGADRIGISAFYQVQDGTVFKVALFHPDTKFLDFNCPECRPVMWQGGQVPIAKRVLELRVVTIDPVAFLSITCVASVGITLALAFLIFNLHFRKLKYIKLSSPRLNNMAVVGCILVYTAVILLGLDHATLAESSQFPTVCTARVYLLSAGFSLAFGSMFTKTYRVHRIFTRSRSGVFKNKLLQDTQLISLIFVLLLIDGLIVTMWVIVDPIQRHLRNLTLEISTSDRGVAYQPQVEVCKSQYVNGWLGALYVYKGLLLIMGLYMAWETRHVKIPALNDSQYIGLSVYSVVITSGLVVVLANLISERATLAFLTVTILILVSTTTTLCLLFVPKLFAILKHPDNCDPIIHSMGLKIECNTRRFVTDDRGEIYYRVQVQNKVYTRELVALDQEINRLKRQLIQSPTGSSLSTSSSRTTSRKVDHLLDERRHTVETDPTAGIGEALPMLLLSVLPPVIPRASWPSAGPPSAPIRRQVTFSSEPKLDDQIIQTEHVESTKIGVFGRLKNFLGGSRSLSRKTSSGSMTGGIASALKAHMGYLAELVPGGNPGHFRSSSCDATMVTEHTTGSAPIISITSGECDERRKFSLVTCISHKDEDDERQHSQPVLPFKERAKGSPRYPHKILPTSSLGALEDTRRNSSSGHLARRQLLLRPRDIEAKCHSLEDATTSSFHWKPLLALSDGPDSDVWRTAEFGIPLSELAFSKRAPGNRRNS